MVSNATVFCDEIELQSHADLEDEEMCIRDSSKAITIKGECHIHGSVRFIWCKGLGSHYFFSTDFQGFLDVYKRQG